MLRLIAGALGALLSVCCAAAQDFYRGKTISVVVSYNPGGGYDFAARVLARHIGKHIPEIGRAHV